MERMDRFKLMEFYAKTTKKWVLYLSTTEKEDVREVKKAVPYLSDGDCMVLMHSCLILSFDNEQEMLECYNKTVGDDGPTITNDYDGWVHVYGLTINNQGDILDENT